MKRPLILIPAALVAFAVPAWWYGATAHSMGGDGMQSGDHAAMMAQCESMMGRMMSMMMPGHGASSRPAPQAPVGAAAASHVGTGVVREVDTAHGVVTIAHDPIASLKWPAMTMNFVVKDRKLFNRLPVDQKVEVEFVQQGADYVVIAVK